jgi:hypothetical protein
MSTTVGEGYADSDPMLASICEQLADNLATYLDRSNDSRH